MASDNSHAVAAVRRQYRLYPMRNNRTFFYRLAFVVAAVFLPLALPTRAQFEDQTAPIVRDIVVETVGAPSISKDRVLANLATKVGVPYSERTAEQDVRALYSTGGVSNVRLFAEPLGDGAPVPRLPSEFGHG